MADVPRVGPLGRIHRAGRRRWRRRLGGQLGCRAQRDQRPCPDHGQVSGVGGAENARKRLDPASQVVRDAHEVPAAGQHELERDDSLGLVAGVDVGQLDEAAYQEAASHGQNEGDSDLTRDEEALRAVVAPDIEPGSGGSPTLPKQIERCPARLAKSRDHAEQDAGQHGQGDGEGQHGGVDADLVEPRENHGRIQIASRQRGSDRPQQVHACVGHADADSAAEGGEAQALRQRRRSRRNRPAPRTRRATISRSRAAACANRRLATLTHAMSSTSPAAAVRTNSAGRTGSVNRSSTPTSSNPGETAAKSSDRVDHAEDGGVGADAERKRRDRGSGEPGVPPQRPQPIADILHHAEATARSTRLARGRA